MYSGGHRDFVERDVEHEGIDVVGARLQQIELRSALTAAREVVFIDADWSAVANAEAVMRVHRLGQAGPVRVRFLGLASSYDRRGQRVLKVQTRALTASDDAS